MTPRPFVSTEAIRELWEKRRTEWAQFRIVVDGKSVADQVIADLDAILTCATDEVLSLHAAADISGYSPDHLGKLIRTGNIPNSGRKGSPRIKRKDLPMRPNRVASGESLAYDVRADARLLKVRR